MMADPAASLFVRGCEGPSSCAVSIMEHEGRQQLTAQQNRTKMNQGGKEARLIFRGILEIR